MILLLLILAGIGLFILGVQKGVFGDLPDEKALREIRNETASLVYSEDDELLGKFFAENRTNAEYTDFPTHLINALVATEDARYFEHSGVDYRSLFRVFFKSLLLGDRSAGGGSTLSQQLAKNLYGRAYHGPLSLPINKVKEAILAGRIEEIYSKEEVLTLYLNTVPFGENIYGAEAASLRFFNCHAAELKIEEAAVLVGMLKANTYYNPRLYPENARKRRDVVISQMVKYNYLQEAFADSLASLPLELDYANRTNEGPANYFLVRVKNEADRILAEFNSQNGKTYDIEKDGLIITTTLNAQMQNMALEAFQQHLGKMQPLLHQHYRGGSREKRIREMAKEQLEKSGYDLKNDQRRNRELFSWKGFYTDSITAVDSVAHELTLLHAGLVAMDPQSGAIRMWVGGIDHRTQPYDQVTAKRQLASAFKPILYAAALEEGITPCTYLSNDTIVFKDHDNWAPRNYDHTYGGSYSMAGALARSVNLPTVALLYDVPRQNLDDLWGNLGFSSELPDGPSVALGSGSASTLELCVAYAAFANGGYRVSPTTIESITTENGETLYERNSPVRNSVLKAESALMMQFMMQQVVNEGTATSMRSVYGVRNEIAGKTGTSQDYADAWFGAYTPGLVVIARAGASMPEIHFNSGRLGSGSTLALPLVGLTMQKVQKDQKLRYKVFSPFPPIPASLQIALDCEDYREPSAIDDFWDLFRAKQTTEEREKRKAEKREEKREKKKDGLLQRLFGKKKNK